MYIKKQITVYISNETNDKLKTFSAKKNWSSTKSIEYILEKSLNKQDAKEKKSI